MGRVEFVSKICVRTELLLCVGGFHWHEFGKFGMVRADLQSQVNSEVSTRLWVSAGVCEHDGKRFQNYIDM